MYSILVSRPMAEHVAAAIALWDHHLAPSAFRIFGGRIGDRDLDKLIDLLDAAGRSGLTRSQVTRKFRGPGRGAEIRQRAIDLGLALEVVEAGEDGPPVHTLHLIERAPRDGGR